MDEKCNIRILDTCLPIHGLEHPLEIVQITDLHLIYTDESDDELMNSLYEQYSQWFFNAPNIKNEIVRFLRNEQPDAVVFTGDISGYPTHANANAIKEILSECNQYLFVYGNHERVLTKEDLTRERMKRYDSLYSFAFKDDNEVQVLELPGVRLIGIDDSDNQITKSQLEKTHTLFNNKKPCLLFLHIPICLPDLIEPVSAAWGAPLLLGVPKGTDVQGDETLIPTAETEEFVRMLTTGKTPVCGIFAGHVHFFDREDEFTPGKKQFITPMANMPETGVVRRIRLIPAEV